MAVSQVDRKNASRVNAPHRPIRLRLATLIVLGVVLLTGAVCTAWFAGDGRIDHLFNHLETIQEYPPFWVQVPMVTEQYLLAPTVMLLLVALLIMKLSPEAGGWSRAIVVTILLLLTTRYILWRSLSTLNVATPLDGVFSLGLFFLEMLMLASGTIQLFLMLRVRDRRREADLRAVAVVEGRFMPSVDILIPSYNEPAFILRRTIVGAQAMDYPNKRVYLLDDMRRPEIQALAVALGCDYVARSDNQFAKAGNLNHAIAQTQGELIVVFDADFVPTRNFLTRTVGFFQDHQVALVQTPQSFYNADPIARNLGLENILTPEEEVFYRQIQPIRDGAGSVICAGTSFVVRRSALEAVGGFVTDSLSEDYFTGIRLSAKGYRLVYLDEKLSAGLAAETMAAHAAQRLRWARGTLQAFFINTNPLTIPGLSLVQRMAHLEGLLHWFTSISRVGYLIIPLADSLLDVIPLRASADELLYFFVPYYVVQLAVFSWLNHHSRSAILSDIYALVLTIPLALTVVQVMLNPFSQGFQVTPKGTQRDRYVFNWRLGLPLIGVFGLTAIGLWRNLSLGLLQNGWATASFENIQVAKGSGLGWLWSSYNLLMLGIALLILLDVPKPDPYDWFDLRRTVRLTTFGQTHSCTHWGITTMLSEGGAEVELTRSDVLNLRVGERLPITLTLLEENLELRGIAIFTRKNTEFPTIRIQFEGLPLQQHRQLIELLFCRPGQWQRRKTPDELRSLLLLFRILLRPRVLFERQVKVRAIAVAKV